MFRVKVNCSWFLDREIPQELDGPLFPLLQAIREFGSLGKSAKRIGTSYRYAWGLVGKWEGCVSLATLSRSSSLRRSRRACTNI